MKRVTVKDIAVRLGIAQGTVSKALCGRPGISAELRQRVYAAAEDLGYSANRLAQSLARKPVTIGVVLPGVWPEYYEPVEKGIRGELSRLRDFKVAARFIRMSGLHCEEEMRRATDRLIEERVEAVLLCPVFNTSCGEHLARLYAQGIPLVLLGTDLPDSKRLTCMRVDAYKAGRLAGELLGLMMCGSKKAAVFIGSRGMLEHSEKCRGAQDELAAAGCVVAGVYETQDVPQEAYMLTQKALTEAPDLEAIYVATGNSIAVCRCLTDQGRERQVRVVATDLFPGIGEYMERGIIRGVIFQKPERQGQLAVRCIYEHLIEKKPCADEMLVNPRLLLRANVQDYMTDKAP